MAARYIPIKYKCSTAAELEFSLSQAAKKRIHALGLTAAEINQTYPSVRLNHLRMLDNDETLGYRMSCAIIEAIGGEVEVLA